MLSEYLEAIQLSFLIAVPPVLHNNYLKYVGLTGD
jgi:hypothetical protein